MPVKRVAVIGAGPGGLTAAKALVECCLDVQVFEATNDIGGQWNLSSPTSAVWPSLYMNTSRRISEFSDFAWEAAIPKPALKDFAGLHPSPKEAKDYLDAYADKFDIRRLIKFNSPVESISLVNGNRWQVHLSSCPKEENMEFDFLVVATGRYTRPNEPLKQPGGALNNYKGKMIHSSEFRHVIVELKGKRLLVVGNSVSGLEIATEAVTHEAQYVAHSMRTVRYNIMTLAPTEDGYRPSDEIMFSRLPVWLGKLLPESMNAAGLKSLVNTYWSQPENVDERFKPSPDIMKAGIAMSRLPYDSGDIALKPLPQSSDGTSKVTFSDSSAEEFDLVINATGYKIDIGFMPANVREEIIADFNGDQDLALYKHTMVPSHPTLAFLGLFNVIGGTFSSLEMQARWTAQVFSGRMALPPKPKMDHAIHAWKQKRSRPGSEYALVTEVNEDIAEELGIAPSILTAFMDSKRRLTGPLFPSEYRAFSMIDSDDVREAALVTFQKYTKEPSVAVLDAKEKADLHLLA